MPPSAMAGSIAAAVLLFLAAVGGFLYWQDRQAKQAEAATEAGRRRRSRTSAAPRRASVPARLDTLAQVAIAKGSAPPPRLSRAALALQKGNRKLASTIYAEVAADSGLAQPFRDLATVRGTALEYDSLKPDEVIARLQPLAEPGKPFFGSAGEMTGMALLAKGQQGRRRRSCSPKIAADKQVPESHPQPRGPDRRLAWRRRQRLASAGPPPPPNRTTRHDASPLPSFSCPRWRRRPAVGLRHHSRRRPSHPDGRRAGRGAGQRSSTSTSTRRPRRSPMTPPAAAANDSWAQSGGNAAQVGRPCRARHSAWRRLDRFDRRGQQQQAAALAAGRWLPTARSSPSTRSGTVRAFDARQRRPGLVGAVRRRSTAIARRSTAAASPSTAAASMPPTALAMSRRSMPRTGARGVDGAAGRPAARRAVGRRRRRLCDEPGQPDLFAQGRRRHDQLVERRRAGNRRRVRRRLARDRPRARSSPASRRASSTPIATRMAARCGRTRCRGPRSRPASRRCRDIDADPVIDDGVVYAVGQGGRMVALDLFSGQRIWELNFGRHRDAVGRGRLAVRGQRQGAAGRGQPR